MNWAAFQQHGEAPTKAFEAFSNQLFENWCKREYGEKIKYFTVVNGAGGDGGVEAYALLIDNTYVGVQSKWFLQALQSSEINQIRGSVRTAKAVRPLLEKYIVCIPRDLADKTAKTRNSEADRWNGFLADMQNEFPDLEIELWNESKLRDELQKDETGGIRRYWFDKEEISLESLKMQFEKSKAGWLRQRYIASLHGQGRIRQESKILLGDFEYRKQLLVLLKSNLLEAESLESEITFGISLFREQQTLETELHHCLKYLHQLKSNLSILIEYCKFDAYPKPLLIYNRPNFDLCLELVEKLPIQSRLSVNRSDLKKAIQKLIDQEIQQCILDVHNALFRKHIIFLGDPGTGKTHGLADIVKRYVEIEERPAFIIQARQYDSSMLWRNILVDVLGLSEHWSEGEIWQALEALAYRCDIRQLPNTASDEEQVNLTRTKILICIDGLDESIPWDHWIERINELKIIIEKFDRIRFCVASRPYVFSNTGMQMPIVWLPSEGDLRVSELYQQYINYYNIKFENEEDFAWLKWSIKTPLALRLFCEQYRNKLLARTEHVATTISHLLSEKIHHVDLEINKRFGQLWSEKEYVVLRSLINISKQALQDRQIERKKLSQIIMSSQESTILDQKTTLKLIEYLLEYGLLYENIKQANNPLHPPEFVYEIAVQPLMDFLLAVQISEDILQNGQKEMPNTLKYRKGAQQMTAIILLQDHDILIGQDGLWTSPSPAHDLLDIQLFALSNVTPEKTAPFAEQTNRLLRKSMPLSRKIINELIAKVARIGGHPLGPLLVHENLMSCKTVGERDLFWSLPEYVPVNSQKSWEGSGVCISSSEQFELLSSDKHNGLPLLYAWQLTVVDNSIRNECRRRITRWGIENPIEFIKLIELTYATNDPQMREDLLSCAFGVASCLTEEHPALKTLAEWMLEEVFEPEKIAVTLNAIIRSAARAVVERAYMFGFVTQEKVDKARPPYPTANFQLELDSYATRDYKEGYGLGSGPIHGDLAQYVIDKGFSDFFKPDYRSYPIAVNKAQFNWSEVPEDLLRNYLQHNTDQKETRIVREVLHKIEQKKEKQKQDAEKLKEMLSSWSTQFLKEMPSENSREEAEVGLNELFSEDVYKIEDILKESEQEEETDERFSTEIKVFLERHAKLVKLSTLTPKQFAIGFAMKFLHKMGWNEEQFYGKPNGGKEGEILGVDIAILRQYWPATHGSQSKIMQFSEKYVWCAIHDMLGYLADRLPFFYNPDGNNRKEMLLDYSLIVDIPNPVQELVEHSIEEIRQRTGWFLPSELSPTLTDCQNDSPETVEKWIRTAPLPEIKCWVESGLSEMTAVGEDLTGEWVSLYNFTSLTEPKTMSDSVLWINSFIITDGDFEYFQKDCENRSDHLLDFFKEMPGSMHSSPKTNTYTNPSALSWMQWVEDDYEKLKVYTLYGKEIKQYIINKCLSQVIYSSVEEQEFTFNLPSKFMRSLLDISSGDGWRFWDKEKNLNAFFAIAGTPYRNSQTLLYVNKDKLKLKLEQLGYRMFWAIRLMREPSIKIKDKYDNFHFQKDLIWLAYKDQEKLILVPVQDQIYQ
jgi:hypothetical protein